MAQPDNSGSEMMQIYLLKDGTAFTSFYYNPETCEGVAPAHKGIKPVVIVMQKTFNEDAESYGERMYVPRIGFKLLKDAANDRDEARVNQVLAQYFE
jgi:hypothetical protein